MLFVFLVFVWCKNEFSPDPEHLKWYCKFDGLITEIVGSFLFLIIIFILMKPSIVIASKLAQIPEGAGGASHLRIKFVNYSIFRAYELKFSVYQISRISLSGSDVKYTLIGRHEGIAGSVPYLESAFVSIFKENKLNAAQLRFVTLGEGTDEKIRKVLDAENSYLEIHVTIRHGLSGLKGNYVRRYHNLTDLKSGFYEHGFRSGVKS